MYIYIYIYIYIYKYIYHNYLYSNTLRDFDQYFRKTSKIERLQTICFVVLTVLRLRSM